MLLTDEQRKQVARDRHTGHVASTILAAATVFGGIFALMWFMTVIPGGVSIWFGRIGLGVFLGGLGTGFIAKYIIKNKRALLVEKNRVLYVAEHLDSEFKEIDRLIKILGDVASKQKEAVGTISRAKDMAKESAERMDAAFSSIKA